MATPSCSTWAGYLSAVERATVPLGAAKARTETQARPAAHHLLFFMVLIPSLPPDSPDQALPRFSTTCRSARKCVVDRPCGPCSKPIVRELPVRATYFSSGQPYRRKRCPRRLPPAWDRRLLAQELF